ncbi:MAG: MFS transporter [Bdellovibrionaceae bacterium]|nr:MFS transporter [Pseudobdellovibrionaceae bacterium]
MRDKKILSWALYDWANSAFATTVMAGFFPLFFKKYWSQGTDPLISTAKLGTTVSLASLAIALMSPTLGVLADLKGYKKKFLTLFMLLGCLSCFWMSQIEAGGWYWAMLAYGFGMIGMQASSVFYDSLLPSVARGHKMDYASSLGFSLGYLGGGILFALNVAMYLKPEVFGLQDGAQAVRWSFATVAIWWLVFSLPILLNVPEPEHMGARGGVWELTLKSIEGLQKTLVDILRNRDLLIFLLAFWLYIDGVYTVITMAVDYGISIGLDSKHLIAALLITQFVGFPFALLFGLLTPRWGCRKPILVCIFVYCISVIGAALMSTEVHFYLLAAVVGAVQGGVQSLSRSLFGKMVPVERSAEYFGFMNIVGKFASISGPVVVLGVSLLTGSHRYGILGLLLLFLLGGWLLWKVKEPDSV